MVGHLVGFGADKGGLDFVDTLVEICGRNGLQTVWEGILQAGIDRSPPIEASTDIVLPKPGLGFVYTERGVFSQGQAVIFRRESLFVEGVSGFVDAAPGHVAEIVLVDTGGDADVVGV